MTFGVTRDRLSAAREDVLILHPGPMNRGVEIEAELADSPRAAILAQVTNGVAVRMAVLYLVSGGTPPEPIVPGDVLMSAHPAGR